MARFNSEGRQGRELGRGKMAASHGLALPAQPNQSPEKVCRKWMVPELIETLVSLAGIQEPNVSVCLCMCASMCVWERLCVSAVSCPSRTAL